MSRSRESLMRESSGRSGGIRAMVESELVKSEWNGGKDDSRRLVCSRRERAEWWLLTPEEGHAHSAIICMSDVRAYWHFHNGQRRLETRGRTPAQVARGSGRAGGRTSRRQGQHHALWSSRKENTLRRRALLAKHPTRTERGVKLGLQRRALRLRSHKLGIGAHQMRLHGEEGRGGACGGVCDDVGRGDGGCGDGRPRCGGPPEREEDRTRAGPTPAVFGGASTSGCRGDHGGIGGLEGPQAEAAAGALQDLVRLSMLSSSGTTLRFSLSRLGMS
ncbi:hypothetical protein FB451DRAFT_1364512 [Mycena latifolia]|nr:hypothetical protein FB451DRAFT_1364512 [Mycena latifolia]